MKTQSRTNSEKPNFFARNAVTLKIITISILALLLLIPSSMIKNLIQERERINYNAKREVTAKWAYGQEICGPILSIPIRHETITDKGLVVSYKYWHILPDKLDINGRVEPQELARGIHKVVVYESILNSSGSFTIPENIDEPGIASIDYDNAFLTIGISDTRGIKNESSIKWNGQEMEFIPSSKAKKLISNGISIMLPNLKESAGKKVAFSSILNLKGSEHLNFIPCAKTTAIKIKSPWTSPKFDGTILPDKRNIDENGFNAEWYVLQSNSHIPSNWIDTDMSQTFSEASFGIDWILPINDYQKSIRTVKYALMTIALTFLVFFLVEILNQRKIHPFQYTLVGLALCLFYTLLVSISEHSNFNIAFGISAFAIVTMISTYSISVFKSPKATLILSLILVSLYTFLFVILQMADFALLMGSVGLLLILGATMFFTRKINWYDLSLKTS